MLKKSVCVVILTIILSSKYFWGNVIGSTTEGARCIAWSQALLPKKNISNEIDLKGQENETYTEFIL